jgi:hypothetical protein
MDPLYSELASLYSTKSTLGQGRGGLLEMLHKAVTQAQRLVETGELVSWASPPGSPTLTS